MTKKLKIKLAIFSVLLATALLSFYMVAGPFISLYGIQSSLEKGKSEKLSCYIDFPVLQENLKIKIRNQAKQSLGFDFSDSDNMLAKFAMKFANQIIDVAVENAVSPTGISMMLSGSELSDLMSEGNGDAQQEEITDPEDPKGNFKNKKSVIDLIESSEFQYISNKKFIFYLPNKDKNKEAGELVFLRSGISWKLSDVAFSQ